MVKLQRAMMVALVVILFVFGIILGVMLTRVGGASSEPRVYNTSTLLQQVKTLSELVTVQYVIEKVVVMEVPPGSTLGQMFAGFVGDNRILLLAHGVVKAGIDLKRMKAEDIEINGRHITLSLPNAQITDAYLDDKQTKVIERKTGFLRSFDKDLEQTVRQNAVDDIRRAARQNGIQRDAEERARLQLENLLLQLGFDKVEFEGNQAVSESVSQ
jgi:hypothetical protein